MRHTRKETILVGWQRIRRHKIHRSGGASPDRKPRVKMVTKRDPIVWHRMSNERAMELNLFDQVNEPILCCRMFIEK